jgi:transporter family protein
MNSAFESWQFWAVLSAVFAALTAIFAKVGVENVNSDFATLIRTVVILLVLAGIVAVTGQAQALGSISGRTYAFLMMSGLATGASWLCYFRALKLGNAAQVAPDRQAKRRAGRGVRGDLPGRAACRDELAGHCSDRHRCGAGRLQDLSERSSGDRRSPDAPGRCRNDWARRGSGCLSVRSVSARWGGGRGGSRPRAQEPLGEG